MHRIASLVALSLSTAVYAAAPVAPDAQASQPTAPAAATAVPEKPICRRTPEIGSLIKVNKRCATRAEWRRIDAGARDATRDMQAMGASSTNR